MSIWKTIHDSLLQDIQNGQYGPGDKLPTEAALAARFGVNRHTVRRALAELAAQDLVISRRGAGVFVQHAPTDYPLGARVRFHQNLRAAGKIPGKKMLAFETRRANAQEAQALALEEGAKVHVYDGLSLSDGHPIAVFRSIFPAERFPEMQQALTEMNSVTAALAHHGVADFTRAETRLSARPCPATQARHLGLRDGAPALFSEGINVDRQGRPVELGLTWFAGERVTLTLEGTETAHTSHK
ncbi:phosphonate metabolism transcriptional regulator PhnF [Aliiroseovarius crassostreae]|uniref:phosphonate metabolism transcriptional regulator PhnF n=1 Tax=Aliiroseovarius crassostreae TaxID=154981 RepID=UPI003C7EC71B